MIELYRPFGSGAAQPAAPAAGAGSVCSRRVQKASDRQKSADVPCVPLDQAGIRALLHPPGLGC